MRELLIVGERPSGPVDADGPLAGRAGRFLATLAGISFESYLCWPRVNLFEAPGDRWDARAARLRARAILVEHPDVDLLLLGRRVSDAFSVPYTAFTAHQAAGTTAYVLPHPSGRNRVWNDREAQRRAARFLRPLLGRARV